MLLQAAGPAERYGDGFWWLLWQAPPQTPAVPAVAAIWAQLSGGRLVVLKSKQNKENSVLHVFTGLYCLSQMESSLENLSAYEKKLIVTGETLAQTEQIIKELDILEKRAQVTLGSSVVWWKILKKICFWKTLWSIELYLYLWSVSLSLSVVIHTHPGQASSRI